MKAPEQSPWMLFNVFDFDFEQFNYTELYSEPFQISNMELFGKKFTTKAPP